MPHQPGKSGGMGLSTYIGSFFRLPAHDNALQILFLSALNGIGNIWALPMTGQIPTKENASEQMALARLLASRIPQENFLAILAWYKVLEEFGVEKKSGAEAAYEIGNLYQDMGREASAINAYESALEKFKDILSGIGSCGHSAGDASGGKSLDGDACGR